MLVKQHEQWVLGAASSPPYLDHEQRASEVFSEVGMNHVESDADVEMEFVASSMGKMGKDDPSVALSFPARLLPWQAWKITVSRPIKGHIPLSNG